MNAPEVVAALQDAFAGLTPKATWGETSLFYNPGGVLPSGVYFCTVKEHDGANDRASNLDRPGVFRVALGLPQDCYEVRSLRHGAPSGHVRNADARCPKEIARQHYWWRRRPYRLRSTLERFNGAKASPGGSRSEFG